MMVYIITKLQTNYSQSKLKLQQRGSKSPAKIGLNISQVWS